MEMSRVETSLTRMEARLRLLFEGNGVLLGIPRKLHSQVLQAIVRAVHKEMDLKQRNEDLDSRSTFAPDQYTIVMPTDQANILINNPEALDRLAQELESYIAQRNLRLAGSPLLRVVPDPTVKELHILLEYSHSGGGDSCTTELDWAPVPTIHLKNKSMLNSFLIVNGLSTYPLTQPVVNIGSDPTNQLVLNDPRVSAIHAQIRFSTDYFAIFNLDFKKGTYVNGMAVSSRKLNPGDVILLAGVPLVFGQETTNKLGYTQELPTQPPALEFL
jgi:hypothetical protein